MKTIERKVVPTAYTAIRTRIWVGPTICERLENGQLELVLPEDCHLYLVGTEYVYINAPEGADLSHLKFVSRD